MNGASDLLSRDPGGAAADGAAPVAPHAPDAAPAPTEFGIAVATARRLREIFNRFPGIEKVWIYGSRARGDHRANSDIDLVVDAPEWLPAEHARLWAAVDDERFLEGIDLSHWQEAGSADFKARVERDRKVFWEPRRHPAPAESLGGIQPKPFQVNALTRLDGYLSELVRQRAQTERAVDALRAAEVDVPQPMLDFPARTWDALKARGRLPAAFADRPHSSRFDGAGRAIANVCLKVPTGGGKTLLAAASVGQVFSSYLGRHAGLVLWIVPNEAIYRQTLKMLNDRDHPYRQLLNVAGAGRVKVLEKDSPLTRLDTESHLCVMLLMLASAARRKTKETLRFFRDRGSVLGFMPREDDIEAHWALLSQVPNLDVYAPWGASQQEARATKGSIIKSSLGNVMRLLRPMVVIDEGHHAYSETALATLDGFNPCFMLELSATPRVNSAQAGQTNGHGSNILVDVRGTDLDQAEMIKLPIHVDMRGWSDWQSCLASALERLDALRLEAQTLQAETNRYIRPILLVQVQRTGKDLRDAGFIHAEDAKAHLLQLGLSEAQIAIKTSDQDDLKAPENIDLLSPRCEVRAIITKQALQEGWDCPFAYVLCALAAGRDVRAMTQLIGRILRQPQVAKTGRPALDACYVLCHDARTGDVVKAIKQSLETEGMGDLGLEVRGADGEPALAQPTVFRRRPQFSALRVFLPRVTWVEADAEGRVHRRELSYESDVLAQIDWAQLDAGALGHGWAPSTAPVFGSQLRVDLSVLERDRAVVATTTQEMTLERLDRALLVRGLLDIAPNAWWVWAWVDTVAESLLARGFTQRLLAASSASLLERLRADLERERDRLAQAVFDDGVRRGAIEFRLRADAADYELPEAFTLPLAGKPQRLRRADDEVVRKSLFEPPLAALVDNGLECEVACYLDSRASLQWWHRNVARAHYGLQGWRRHKVYPDFVFARMSADGAAKLVVLETKGLHLAGSEDTHYKQALLDRLTRAFADERLSRAGELELVGARGSIVCDLVVDTAWEGSLNDHHFRS